jgi:hypothetical protein
MSKLGCKCGHIIRGQTDNISYKGRVLPDARYATFFDWLVEETQSYVETAHAGRVEQWLLERGYGQDYVDRKRSHGDVCTIASTHNSACLSATCTNAKPAAASTWRRAMTISS